MPLNDLLSCIKTSSRTALNSAASKLICNTVININMGFSVDSIGDHHWLYFPERNIPFYRLGFWHNLNPASAPPGKTAVYGEVSYNPKKTSVAQAQNITSETKKSILQYLKLGSHHVIAEKIMPIKHAYVIYDAWRQKNVPTLIDELKNEGIYSVGRYGGWKYSGMQEAVLDGRDAAIASLLTLKSAHPNIIPAQRASEEDMAQKKRRQPHGTHTTVLQK